MRQIVIFLAMATVFTVISCGPKSHMILKNHNMSTESQAIISGDASAVAEENRDVNRDLAMAKLYEKLVAAKTSEERDELLKAIAVMEGRTEVPFFRGPANGSNYNQSRKITREEIQERAGRKIDQKQNRRY